MANIGTVVLLTGQAVVININGEQHVLKLGDSIAPGDTIIAPKGTLVELELANGSRIQIDSNQAVNFTQELSDAILYDQIDPNANAVTQETVQALIQAISSNDNIDDIISNLAQQRIAANEGIFAEEGGHAFVELLRVDEILNQFDYNYDVASLRYLDPDPMQQDRDVLQGSDSAVYLPRIDADLNSFNFRYGTKRPDFDSRRYFLYKCVQIITGIELPCEVEIGEGFVIDHFGGIVVSGYAKFGKRCRIRNGVVVGLKNINDHCAPQIGDDVDIGAGAKVLGNITIGNRVSIGANAVVISDVPDDHMAVGVPATIKPIKKKAA